MQGPDQTRFMQMLEAARTRRSSDDAASMIVPAHLAQMRLFMTRQGIEFHAKQDSYGQRRDFIERVLAFNKLPGRLEGIIDSFLIDGRGLFYFRPSKDLYRVHYFRYDQYRAYYDDDGDLTELQIIYSFKVRPPKGFGASLGAAQVGQDVRFVGGPSNAQLRWIKLEVYKDRVEQTISEERPEFDGLASAKKTVMTNALGFIPAVEVFNNRSLEEGEGYGEFDWLASHILEHDRLVRSIRKNVHFFGNPTLVSSRPRHDLIEPDEDGAQAQRATVASNSGFNGVRTRSTRVSEPGYGGDALRVPRVIANVEAADRVGYISPDAVSGDLTSWTTMCQEMIRTALGGVDDLSINSGATAYEVKTLYGRVSATAKRKCRDLFEYGLCQLFQLMIFHEETLFRESLAVALGIIKPEPPLEETIPPEQFPQIMQMYQQLMQQWNEAVNSAIMQIKKTGEVPPGVIGLIPDGETTVLYRWMGEVFPQSNEEILQASIVVRNLQEIGVDSLEALMWLFPEKTPEERAAMLGGYPFRVAEATQRAIGITIDTIRAFFSTPHPQEPDLPLAADPALDLTPYLYRTLAHLRTELTYGGRYSERDATVGIPDTLTDADRLRAARGLATGADRADAQRRASFAAAARFVAGSRPGQLGFDSGAMAAGIPGDAGRLSYSESPVFGAGGTLAYDPADSARNGAQLGSGAGPGSGFGEPDLAAPTNAGLLPAAPGPAPVPAGPAAGANGAGGGAPSRNGTKRRRRG